MINKIMGFSLEKIHQYFSTSSTSTLYYIILYTIIIIVISLIGYFLHKFLYRYIFKLIKKRFTKKTTPFQALLFKYQIFHRIYLLALLLILQWIIPYAFIIKILNIGICLSIALLISSFLSIGNDFYNYSFKLSKQKPIKSYTDIIKIITWVLSAIFIIAILTNSAAANIFTGLGALSAVLLFIFRDPIMGLITSIQISAYDIVRIGDWIQIKNYNVDGDITDISLNAVKVQNFDKTIVTIPTSDFMKHGIINFRGMHDAGGRRIKRAICVDIDTIKFCDKYLLEKLEKYSLINNYILQKKQQSQKNNTIVQLTNVGLYRKYMENYLTKNSLIKKNFTFLVRQLNPHATGLPIEIYVFTNTTIWKKYEAIQADIFDHLLAIAPHFDLRIFQHNKFIIPKYNHDTRNNHDNAQNG